MLIDPTGHWEALRRNCVADQEDLDHLNRYPYDGIRPTAEQMLGFLQNRVRCWLVQMDGEVVGFLNYGNVIPWQPNAFGLAIGRRFIRRGYGRAALDEFLRRREELGIDEVNGYCNRNNLGIIRLMEQNGFARDHTFGDPRDPDAVKFVRQAAAG